MKTNTMREHLLPALRALLVLTLLTGVLYPLLVTGVGQLLFGRQANSSLIERDGVIVGSALIGQHTDDARYFWWRPSAVNALQAAAPGTLVASGGSNLGPTSATLAALVAEWRAAFSALNGLAAAADVPADVLFASGSGLDPHISPAAARLQINRVAAARGLAVAEVAALVEQYVEAPQLGVLGEARVNVLALNLALDDLP